MPNHWSSQQSVWLLFLCFALGQLSVQGTVLCETSDGYRIESLPTALLSSDAFTVDSLRRYFLRVMEGHRGEFGQAVVSDQKCFEALQTPLILNTRTGSAQTLSPPKGPTGRLFVNGDNAIFEYRTEEGRIGWEILWGRNFLSQSLEGVRVSFVAEKFSGRWEIPACDGLMRSTVFIVPELSRLEFGSVVRILQYYDSLFTHPPELEVDLY